MDQTVINLQRRANIALKTAICFQLVAFAVNIGAAVTFYRGIVTDWWITAMFALGAFILAQAVCICLGYACSQLNGALAESNVANAPDTPGVGESALHA